MSKKNLTEVFRAKREQEQGIEPTTTAEPKEANQNLPPSRQGKKRISGWFRPEAKKQILYIAADEDKTQEQVMADAFNELFRNRGLPPIA